MKNARCIHPQDVYGVIQDETCRECRFCDCEKGSFLLPGDRDTYCTRFYRIENPKTRINAYDQACGKFEKRCEV